jgi:formylglycine-generating enzyme
MKNINYIKISVVPVMVLFFCIPLFSQNNGNDLNREVSCDEPREGEVWIEGGEYVLGEDQAYEEEKPQHKVSVKGFWIDEHEVTNNQFEKFTKETGYVTVAERVPDTSLLPDLPEHMKIPGSVVFTPPKMGVNIVNWWQYVPGANWKNPLGPGSSIEGKGNYPVVHVAFEDALSYAKWADRDLPTEAQFEIAARNKLANSFYSGGDSLLTDGRYTSNTWQGLFPVHNSIDDGFEGIAPVNCYPPNNYGVHDLIGNVWEWTQNWYKPRHNPQDSMNPVGPDKVTSFDPNNKGFPVKVIKGGSFLCARSYCKRYRPAARHAQDTGLGTQHIGFRTVKNM